MNLKFATMALIFILSSCVQPPPPPASSRVSKPAVPQEYRSIFKRIEDFPRITSARLVWKQISRGSQGPYVEMIYGSNLARREIYAFYDEALLAVDCTCLQALPQPDENPLDRNWSCVSGYQDDVSVMVNDGDPKYGYRWWVVVRFNLASGSPGIYTTKDPANRDSVPVMPPLSALERLKPVNTTH